MQSCLGHSSCPSNVQGGTGPQEGLSTTPDPIVHRRFHLDNVQGCICTTQMHHSSIWDHKYPQPDRCLRALYMDPCVQGASPGPPATHLHCTNHHTWGVAPGSSWVVICLRNLGAYPIVVLAKVIIRKITPANQVLLVTLLMGTSGGSPGCSWKDWILYELNLQGLDDWPENEQRQTREQLTRWEHLFACSDLDLGKMSLIKYQTELTDQMLFKEHYQCIPPYVWSHEGLPPGNTGQ